MSNLNEQLTTFLFAVSDRLVASTGFVFAIGLGSGLVVAYLAYILRSQKNDTKPFGKLKTETLAEIDNWNPKNSVLGTWKNNQTHKFPLRAIDISIKQKKRVPEVLGHIDGINFTKLAQVCELGFTIHHKNPTEVIFIGMTKLSNTPVEFTIEVFSCAKIFQGRWLLSSIPLENQDGKVSPKENELLVSSAHLGNVNELNYVFAVWEYFSREEAVTYFQEIVDLAADKIENEYSIFKNAVKNKTSKKKEIESNMATWGITGA